MNKDDRNTIKKIARHQDLETNLPLYSNSYMNSAYEYGLIRLVLNYYTLKEVFDEGGSILEDDKLLSTLDAVHTIIFEAIISHNISNEEELKGKLDTLREKLTREMRILTAYTDALQIYEYVLNRVEFGITGEKYEVDINDLSDRLFRYMFSENDKMVINSKIQMVTAQLPIRMAKSRFFDYLNDTLNIYNGSDVDAVDDFCDMLKSTALLETPEGYGEEYTEIYNLIRQLENTDYKELDSDTYHGIMEQFAMTTTHLTDIVSNHLLAMETVNALYSVLLALPYADADTESINACISMIGKLHDAYVSQSGIPETVDEEFYKIEGRQEILGEDIMQFESVLPDIIDGGEDEISWIMADKIFSNLDSISKLMSNSLFIELHTTDNNSETADAAYIQGKRDELTVLFSGFFKEHSKEINRAVMALVFSNMPVLFNSMQETKEYIEYSLEHCRSESELMACGKILDDMMEEE